MLYLCIINELNYTIMESEKVKGLILEGLWEICYRAHTWTSFSPDKRATQVVTEFSNMLENDLKELGENQGNYKEKFIAHLTAWMNAKSNCASTMITGGSNFNVRRADKANTRERAKSNEFAKWRDGYFKAVNRVATLSPEEELDNALQELDVVTNKQLMMKEINALIRKSKTKNTTELTELFITEGYPDELIQEAHTNNRLGYGFGFASFELTNNNAKIKRLSQKVLTMKSRIETKATFEDIKFDGGYLTISDDRVKIFHNDKPGKDVIEKIKSNGFRWSPFWKCWCRKHTMNALNIGINLTKLK